MTAPGELTRALASRWSSVAWGEPEWEAALVADPDLYRAILHGIGKAYRRSQAPRAVSPMEIAALTLAAQGCGTGEIAARSYISTSTVKDTLTRARGKLGARNTTHAVAIAVARNLIPRPRPAT